MTDTNRADHRIAQLDRLAAKAFELVKDLHAQLLAATDARTIAKLARAYELAGRNLRQTLALRARLVRARAAEARRVQMEARAAALRAFREARPGPTLH